MTVAGVIAEFDPFHLGHQNLFREIRRRLGEDCAIIAVMSGCFTQRGGAAICTPQARAEMALLGSADLVLELPIPFSSCSAEQFARSGVELLIKTGVADALCFGSECGDIELLREMAGVLDTRAFSQKLQQYCADGAAFASARMRALEEVTGGKSPAGANDLLAIEYLRFWPGDRPAMAILRQDGGHGGTRSASQVRTCLLQGKWNQGLALLPEGSQRILLRERQAGYCPANLAYAERAVLYRLRTMTEADFAALPDCTEGLEHRLVQAAGQASELEEFYALVKSKRYAHARIRRLVLRAFLGIDRIPAHPAYLQVLGANHRGLELLKEMKTKAQLPVITKPAHGRRLTGEALTQFSAARRADALWALCLEKPAPSGWSWRTGPVILEDI